MQKYTYLIFDLDKIEKRELLKTTTALTERARSKLKDIILSTKTKVQAICDQVREEVKSGKYDKQQYLLEDNDEIKSIREAIVYFTECKLFNLNTQQIKLDLENFEENLKLQN